MSDYPGLMAGTGLLPPAFARSIARLEVIFGDPAGGTIDHGTGFLVRRANGASYLATAAHVIYKPDFQFAGEVRIFLGQNGGASAKVLTVSGDQGDCLFVPADFRKAVPPPGSDFGLVRIDDPQGDLAGFEHFVASSAEPVQNVARLYGYPKNTGAPQSQTPHYTILEVVPEGTECFSYAHVADQPGPAAPATYKGMSGGPLIGNSSTDDTNRVFGIHTRGGTDIRATRCSPAVRQAMRDWINAH